MALSVFLILVIAMIVSIPIGVAIGLSSIYPGLINPHFAANVQFVIRGMVSGIDSTPILAVPLFILSGVIMARGEIAKKLFDVFAYFVGNKTAGMPIAVVLTSLFYGAISGSGIATTAAVGGMCIPILISMGYDKVFSAALVATAGGLGVIIPPSIPFIMYGLTTGVSVGALFTAGILPGILIGLFLMSCAYIYCRKYGEDKEKINANYKLLREKGFLNVFKESFWALMTPVIILGGIYSGIVTPTEAACISVFYSLFVCVFIYRTMKINEIIVSLKETVKSIAPLSLLLSLAVVFGRVLAMLRAPELLGNFIVSNFANTTVLLLVMNMILIILGMFMDIGPAIVILAPILLPVMQKFGVDPVHLGIIMTTNLAIGFVTPPFGVDLFVASPLINTPVMEIGKKAIPFIISFIFALLLITDIPEISLILLR